MKLTVIGTGYLGAVHAAGMAELGHDVLGVDVDESKVAALAAGRPPFFEPDLPALLSRAVASGRLRFTTSLREAAEFGDVHFICVGTPQQPGSQAADMGYIDAVVDGLAPHLERPCLVAGKSTVPVGTAARLIERIAASAPVGRSAEVAWNPEFLREGFAVQDTLHPDRIVVGVTSEAADATLQRVYGPILDLGTPWVSTDLPTAELVKVSANAFLATKISFINAMSEVCEASGADVVTLAEAIGHDTRIGNRFLRAGLGFGGGCLPKDIRAFRARAEELGVGEAVSFLGQVEAINLRRRASTVAAARRLAGGSLAGARVGVLGAAFKPDSDDVRDSPALAVATMVAQEGATVRIHDPEAMDNARAVNPDLDFAPEAAKVFEGADVVLHLTEWSQYRDLEPTLLSGLTRTPNLVDARNNLDIGHWRAAGWTVHALGRSAC